MKVTVLTPALREIIAALEYYEEQARGLARSLDADLTRSLDFVSENPHLGSPIPARYTTNSPSSFAVHRRIQGSRMRFSWSPSHTRNSAPGIGETVCDVPTGGRQLTLLSRSGPQKALSRRTCVAFAMSGPGPSGHGGEH